MVIKNESKEAEKSVEKEEKDVENDADSQKKDHEEKEKDQKAETENNNTITSWTDYFHHPVNPCNTSTNFQYYFHHPVKMPYGPLTFLYFSFFFSMDALINCWFRWQMSWTLPRYFLNFSVFGLFLVLFRSNFCSNFGHFPGHFQPLYISELFNAPLTFLFHFFNVYINQVPSHFLHYFVILPTKNKGGSRMSQK